MRITAGWINEIAIRMQPKVSQAVLSKCYDGKLLPTGNLNQGIIQPKLKTNKTSIRKNIKPTLFSNFLCA
jgi:hypothetical protein